jgi:hypothetical protein
MLESKSDNRFRYWGLLNNKPKTITYIKKWNAGSGSWQGEKKYFNTTLKPSFLFSLLKIQN